MSRKKFSSFTLFFLLTGITLSSFGQGYSTREITLRPKAYDLDIVIDFAHDTLDGTCRLTLTNTGDQPVQKADLVLYRLLRVNGITSSRGTSLEYTQQVVSYEDFRPLQVNYIQVPFEEPLQKNASMTLSIDYSGYLLGYAETGMSYIKDRIDPEFTIIRPDCRAYPQIGVPCWEVNRRAGLPEFTYRISITVPDSLMAVNSGMLIDKKCADGDITFSYKSMKPAWRIDVAVSKYGLLENNIAKVFYLAQDSLRAGKILETMNRTISLYTDWFGPLPDQSQFTLIEIPDGWGSQTTASCIIQSAGAFKNDRRLYELYHEISHLWNVPETDPKPPRWQEGLAMFLQYLTIEKLEQRTVLDQQAEQMLKRLQSTFSGNPRYQHLAMIDFGEKNATGLSYTAGMLFFYTMYSLTGEDNFLHIINSFDRIYHQQGATTEEFITYAKKSASVDLSHLFQEWFYEPTYIHYIEDGLSLHDIVAQYR